MKEDDSKPAPSAKVIRQRERAKAWQLANPDQYRANQKRWGENNREKKRLYGIEYRASKGEEIKKQRAQQRAENREILRQRGKARYKKPEYAQKAKDRSKRWRMEHPEQYRQQMRQYREKNADALNQYVLQWRRDNPERAKAITRNASNTRRTRNLAVGEISLTDMRAVLARGTCAACSNVHPRMEVDHIVALSRGGTNHVSNLQLLCQPCNRSKWTFDNTEWLQRRHHTTL